MLYFCVINFILFRRSSVVLKDSGCGVGTGVAILDQLNKPVLILIDMIDMIVNWRISAVLAKAFGWSTVLILKGTKNALGRKNEFVYDFFLLHIFTPRQFVVFIYISHLLNWFRDFIRDKKHAGF